MSQATATKETEVLKAQTVTDNQVISGFDAAPAPVQFCSPSFLGNKICLKATAPGGQLTLTLEAQTIVGNYGRSFSVPGNLNFTWQPISRFKFEIRITNYVKSGNSIRFTAAVKAGVSVPIVGWQDYNYSYSFTVPSAGRAAHGFEGDKEISDNDFANLLAIHLLINANHDCNCNS